MTLSTTKASTQDQNLGTPVATIINEDTVGAGSSSAGLNTPAIQAMCATGSKSTWNELARTGINTADTPTGGDLSVTGFAGVGGSVLLDLANALSLNVRATCTVAGASLLGVIIFYDVNNNALGKSEVMTFVSDATLRLGNGVGDFIAQRYLLDPGSARKARFLAQSVSAGSWSVYVRPI